jgi:hypothetical protein
MRFCAIFGIAFLVLATCNSGFCQGVPRCYPACVPNAQPCPINRPAPTPPITRTIQVDVPVPCAPVSCGRAMTCQPYPCALACPPQPVNVKVEMIVRPEVPQPCPPQTLCCENPPVFEPIFCQAAALLQSLIVAPLAMGEMFMGHPVPSPLPVPCPMPCWRQPAAMCPPCFQLLPSNRCVVPGPRAKVRHSCVPVSASTHPPNGSFPGWWNPR